MTGATRNGPANLNMATTKVAALSGVEVIIITAPAYGHLAFAEAIAPFSYFDDLRNSFVALITPSISSFS